MHFEESRSTVGDHSVDREAILYIDEQRAIGEEKGIKRGGGKKKVVEECVTRKTLGKVAQSQKKKVAGQKRRQTGLQREQVVSEKKAINMHTTR